MKLKIIDESTANAEKKKKRKMIMIIIFLLVFVITAGITSYIFLKDMPYKANNKLSGNLFPEGGGAQWGHLPKMTEDEIREQMQREADKSVFSFKINSRPLFQDGDSEGTLNIENPNHNLYPFVVEIFLNETGEEIYNSGGILPNHHISRAKLTKTLEKGEHPATAYINVYDPVTKHYTGKSAVWLTIVVKA